MNGTKNQNIHTIGVIGGGGSLRVGASIVSGVPCGGVFYYVPNHE